MSHRAKKRFGQNFLEDAYVIQQIMQAISPQACDNLIEIGPGLGALTKPLLEHVHHVSAIEIDQDIHHILRAWPAYHEGQLSIIAKDALTVDFSAFGQHLRVVGNLPYNISTPLIFHLLEHVHNIQDMHFMLQKEVVDRLAASPNSKAYGKLTIMTQAQCAITPLFDVPNTAFRPAPKVTSAVVRLIPHAQQPKPEVLKTLGKLLTQAFSARRKTLSNSLKGLCTIEQLDTIGISPKQRIEDLSVEICLKLANFLNNSCIIR